MPSTNFADQLARLRGQLDDNEAWFGAHPGQQPAYQQRRNALQRQITHLQRQAAAQGAPAGAGAQNVGGAQVGNAPAGTGPNVNTGVGNAGTATNAGGPVAPPVVTPPTGPTQAELAAAETDRQGKMRARRDEWDRLNNQGKYDPDGGWQSMGYQPDPVAMPSWWLDGLELGTTAPAVPLPLPPQQVVPPPVVPPVVPPVTPPAAATNSGAATNATPPGAPPAAPSINTLFGTGMVPPVTVGLTPAAGSAWPNAMSQVGTGGQAQNTAAKSGQGAWGAWGQPSAMPWGARPMGMKPQPWTQPVGQMSHGNTAGLQAWTQPARPTGQVGWGTDLWSQGQPQPWTQKPAGQMNPSWR